MPATLDHSSFSRSLRIDGERIPDGKEDASFKNSGRMPSSAVARSRRGNWQQSS